MATVPETARTVLVVLRHGDAGDAFALPLRDAQRMLTPKGRKQARRAGKVLAKLGLKPRDVWTSGLARAAETARLAMKSAKSDARTMNTAALKSDAVPDRIARALHETPPPPPPQETPPATPRRRRTPSARRRPVASEPVVRWVVGHEPHLSRFVGFLTGSPQAAFDLKKGAFAVLECDGRGPVAGGARLSMLVPPDTVRAAKKI